MRVLIINWRFTGLNTEFAEFDVDSADKVIFSAFKKEEDDSKENIKEELKAFKNKIDQLISSDDIKILVLTHSNPPNNITILDIECLFDEKSEKMKIDDFWGGSGRIYLSLGQGIINVDKSDVQYYSKEDIGSKIFTKVNFEYVWDYYWNWKTLQYQKKKLIDLILPLTIDIHGLSETDNPDYLKGVIDEYTQAKLEDLKKDWTDIKKALAPDTNIITKEGPEEHYKLSNEEKRTITESPIKELLNFPYTGLQDFIKENASAYRSISTNVNTLPVWLNKVIEMLENKINSKSVWKIALKMGTMETNLLC